MNISNTQNIEYKKPKYPNDQKYRETLAENINCSPENLMSVIGTEELNAKLSELTFDNFSTGENLKNIKNKKFIANLHLHTQESDGTLTVNELLDQAVKYANKIEKTFFIAITNHDSLYDAQKAIKLIGENPKKYEKIKFIPGIEFNAKYENKDLFSKPVQLELVGYCINPFDGEINRLLDQIKEQNFNYAESIVNKVNNLGIKADIEEAKNFHPLIKVGGSPGFFSKFEKYIQHKDEIKHPEITDIFKEHLEKYGSKSLTESTPTVQELANLINKAKFGKLGISHPGRINIDNPIRQDKLTEENKTEKYKKAISDILENLKKIGIKAAETHYQYKPKYEQGYRSVEWFDHVNNECKKLEFIPTGGLDTHSNNIFTRYLDLDQNKLLEILGS